VHLGAVISQLSVYYYNYSLGPR